MVWFWSYKRFRIFYAHHHTRIQHTLYIRTWNRDQDGIKFLVTAFSDVIKGLLHCADQSQARIGAILNTISPEKTLDINKRLFNAIHFLRRRINTCFNFDLVTFQNKILRRSKGRADQIKLLLQQVSYCDKITESPTRRPYLITISRADEQSNPCIQSRPASRGCPSPSKGCF